MSYTETELSELICTRISHDLIGNIGALSGALELIKDNQNILDEDTLGIISTATETLKARQKFFRLAFGTNNNTIEMPELMKICTDYLATIGNRHSEIYLHIQGITPELAKILCLCVMTAAEVCIKGGNITVSVNKQNLQISLESDYKLAENKIDIYRKILQNQKPNENISQYAHLIYLRELIGKNISVDLQSDEKHMKCTIG